VASSIVARRPVERGPYSLELQQFAAECLMPGHAAEAAHQLRNSSHTPRQLFLSVNQGVPVTGGSLLASRPWAAGRLTCNRLASRAGFLQVPHRLVQSSERRVQIGAGLLK